MLKEVYYDNFPAMGTRFALVIPRCSHFNGDSILETVKNEIKRLEKLFNRFDKESAVSEINRNASTVPVKAVEEFLSIISECIVHSRNTSGAFDITLKALADFWNASSPHQDEKVKPVLNNLGMDKLLLDEKNETLFFKTPELSLDLGAVAKGIALRNTKSILIQSGISDAFISFGESSIYGLGSHPEGEYWQVSIPDLYKPANPLYTFNLKDMSVSTSGNTMNNMIPGRINIINPFTGYPVSGFITAAALNQCPVIAEVLSTAAVVLDDAGINSILEKFPGSKIVKIVYDKNNNAGIKEFSV